MKTEKILFLIDQPMQILPKTCQLKD